MTQESAPASEATSLDLDAIVANLRADTAYESSGHTARTLLRTSDMRIVLVALEKGRRMQEHETQETVVIHVLSGNLHLDLPHGPMNLFPGQIVTIEKGARHAVEAYSDSAFLLTLGWPARPGD